MSSNPIPITRSNYEEYFLLYIDNELSEADRSAVEAFAMLHPDLGEELELLGETTLEASDFSFDGKESLLAEKMELTVVDESLLLYIDNELPPIDQHNVETQLHSNTAYKAHYDALLQAKLARTDTIIYPHKEELYRHTERRRPLFWMQAAAVVVLIAGAGTFFALQGDDTAGTPLPVATVVTMDNTPKKVDINTVNPITQTTVKEELAVTMPAATGAKSNHRKIILPRAALPKPATQERLALQVSPSPQDRVLAEEVAVNLKPRTTAIESGTSQQTFNTNAVTAADLPAYTTYNAVAKVEPTFAGGIEKGDDKEQGSVRGLLRKATRFIERRTGIKATDEEDRLLVGAVAISLK